MRPQKILKRGRTEASVLLFAHNPGSVENNLIGGTLTQKHNEFVAFVIRDLLSD